MAKNGFSLIELIIVIAIMGLISTIVYPSFSKVQVNAKNMAIKTNLNSIQVAIESYYINNGVYPEGTNLNIFQLANLLKESGELTKIPLNPFTQNNYSEQDESGKMIYSFDEISGAYSLIAYGARNKDIIAKTSNI